MAKKFQAGEGIQGDRVLYLFGYVPESADLRKGRYSGHMTNSGRAVVEERCAAVLTPLPKWAASAKFCQAPLDEILCQETRFSCTDPPNLPGLKTMKSGKHTGFQGIVTGEAAFQITKPLASAPKP